jgi:formylglycine-generating enzyme required for sulfatase activity
MVRALTTCLAVLVLVSAGNADQLQATAPSGEPCDGALVPVAPSNSGHCIKPGSGESFKDCPECPEMVVVPAGSFTMGSPADELDGKAAKVRNTTCRSRSPLLLAGSR